jgi:hypothetical protein
MTQTKEAAGDKNVLVMAPEPRSLKSRLGERAFGIVAR